MDGRTITLYDYLGDGTERSALDGLRRDSEGKRGLKACLSVRDNAKTAHGVWTLHMTLVGNGDIIDEYLGRARGTESVDAEIDGLILSRSDLLAIRLEDGARERCLADDLVGKGRDIVLVAPLGLDHLIVIDEGVAGLEGERIDMVGLEVEWGARRASRRQRGRGWPHTAHTGAPRATSRCNCRCWH